MPEANISITYWKEILNFRFSSDRSTLHGDAALHRAKPLCVALERNTGLSDNRNRLLRVLVLLLDRYSLGHDQMDNVLFNALFVARTVVAHVVESSTNSLNELFNSPPVVKIKSSSSSASLATTNGDHSQLNDDDDNSVVAAVDSSTTLSFGSMLVSATLQTARLGAALLNALLAFIVDIPLNVRTIDLHNEAINFVIILLSQTVYQINSPMPFSGSFVCLSVSFCERCFQYYL